jgi:transcriptional regulator with XRE-family HTH domain
MPNFEYKILPPLIDLRKKAGLTQTQVGELFGIGKEAVSKKERGENSTSIFEYEILMERAGYTSIADLGKSIAEDEDMSDREREHFRNNERWYQTKMDKCTKKIEDLETLVAAQSIEIESLRAMTQSPPTIEADKTDEITIPRN